MLASPVLASAAATVRRTQDNPYGRLEPPAKEV
jgi:hypothetical protein